MELLAKVKIENLFKAKDFKDKKSGEITTGKWKIQTFDSIQTDDGVQMKLMDISISDALASQFKNKIGETVTLSVGTYVNNGKVGFYGL